MIIDHSTNIQCPVCNNTDCLTDDKGNFLHCLPCTRKKSKYIGVIGIQHKDGRRTEFKVLRDQSVLHKLVIVNDDGDKLFFTRTFIPDDVIKLD